MRKLNIGCGPKHKEGFINIDIDDYGQEVIRDVRKGLPFDTESVDYIYSCHFLEHLDGEEASEFLKEAERVLKKGATMEIIVPHSSTDEALFLPHKSYWNEKMLQSEIKPISGIKSKYNFTIESMGRSGIHFIFVLKK